jgi:hypothetical protein
MTYEIDFSDWGYWELDQAKQLIESMIKSKYNKDLICNFKIVFNPEYPKVLIVDTETEQTYEVGKDDQLEQTFECMECNNYGFICEFKQYAKKCCEEVLNQ